MHVQAPKPEMNKKHRHSKCHYKWNSGSPLRRYEQPHSIGMGVRSNRRLTSGSPPPALTTTTTAPAPDGRTAAAQASGWALLRACPRPRRRSRGEDKYEEPEARSADGGGDPVGHGDFLKGKCALGPFLSILVIECQHKCLNVNLCSWMDKVQIKSKGMFLSLSTLVLCTNILV
jgi:hypothetical protein